MTRLGIGFLSLLRGASRLGCTSSTTSKRCMAIGVVSGAPYETFPASHAPDPQGAVCGLASCSSVQLYSASSHSSTPQT
eukprot:4480202-Amphidinium_carterae.1